MAGTRINADDEKFRSVNLAAALEKQDTVAVALALRNDGGWQV